MSVTRSISNTRGGSRVDFGPIRERLKASRSKYVRDAVQRNDRQAAAR